MCAQLYVGSVLQKAYLRFLGTLIGCLLAAITLGQHPTILFAGQRFLEISMGILIATVISQFVLPIHARTHLRRAQAETLEQLRDFYVTAMITHTLDSQDLDENIVKSISRQRQLAKESQRERFGEKFDTEHFVQTLYCEKEILRSISLMHNAYTHIKNAEASLANLPELHTLNDTIQQSFNVFIKVVELKDASKEHIHLPNLNTLREAAQANMQTSPPEQLVYIDGFLFSAEILTETLAKLAELNQVMVYKVD